MGFNSVVFICNNAVSEIEKDPEGWWRTTWENLVSKPFKSDGRYGFGNHGNAFQAVWNQHADRTALILAGKNRAKLLNNYDDPIDESDLQKIKHILNQHGYDVVKKRSN